MARALQTLSTKGQLANFCCGVFMRKLLSISLVLAFGLGSCSKPESRLPPRKGLTPVSSKDLEALQNREVSRIPTLPTGGLVKGKSSAIPTEENIKRQIRNRELPVTWNDGFAGITMQTTREESKKILSDPQYSLDNGMDIYAEGLQITWGKGLNPTPESVRMYSDYLGYLKLPAPYGDVKLGESIAALEKEESLENFIKVLGRTFAGKDATYDCLAVMECSVDIRDGGLAYIDFPSGNMILGGSMIYVIDFSKNTDFVPKNKLPIVFNESIAGIKPDMTKEQVEAFLGTPYKFPDGLTQLYDAKTIRITYNAKNQIEDLIVLAGYEGTFTVGGKVRGIGTSFADLTTIKDDADGLLMMKNLGKMLLGKESDPAYDCSAVKPNPTCQSGHDKTNGIIRILVGNMIFSFTDDDTRTLMAVSLFNDAV